MVKLFAAAIGVLALSTSLAWGQCRQALALGLDVSGSVDTSEYRLQLDGLANAMLHPDVRRALLAMPSAPVSLLVYEWSGPNDQPLVLDWIAVESEADIAEMAAQLRKTQRRATTVTTAIGAAMVTGIGHLNRRSECWTRTLDISGDGKSNTGPNPDTISRSSLIDQITINALVIGAPPRFFGDTDTVEISELSAYFTAYVITAPDGFVETALGFSDFEAAMTRKLLRELQGMIVSQLPQAPTATQ